MFSGGAESEFLESFSFPQQFHLCFAVFTSLSESSED